MCSVHPILLACLAAAVLCAPVSSAGSDRAGVLTPPDVLRTSVRSASLASIEEAALPPVPEVRPAPRMRLGADWGIPAHIRPRDGDDAFRGAVAFVRCPFGSARCERCRPITDCKVRVTV